MAKRTKTLSQHQMYRIWDTMEDILMFVEIGEYELPRIENVEIGHGQPESERSPYSLNSSSSSSGL